MLSKKSSAIFILIVLLFSSSFATIAYSDINGKPYVSGTTIYAGNGTPLRLQGFNAEEDISLESIQWLKNNGFNNLRLEIYWHRYEPQKGAYSNTYFNRLDTVVNYCQQNGIYVYFDFHHQVWSPYFTYYSDGQGMGFPSWLISGGGYEDSAAGATKCATDFYLNQGYGVTMRQQYLKFWQYLANRYKSYSCVWGYELLNEPEVIKSATFTQQTLESIMDFYETITPKIRQVDPDTIIVYHKIDFNPNPRNYNAGYERAVSYSNIVWTRSWYDVGYGGYSSSEFGELQTRITNIKNKYNGVCRTPFIASEMGLRLSEYPVGTEGQASAWIRDTFEVMRNVGLNNGYECYSWYIYDVGPKHGFWTGRNYDGSSTFITPVLKEYMMPSEPPTPTPPPNTETPTQFSCEAYDMGTSNELQVSINGNRIYTSTSNSANNNQWVTLSLDLTDYIIDGTNTLEVANPTYSFCLIRNVKITVNTETVIDDATQQGLQNSEITYTF